jgi:AraC-like DNA-binding protein/quercetin dioxygenase-like cupin family protein
MKPILFKVTRKEDAAFLVQTNHDKPQYHRLHLHPEYQISLVEKGSGTVQLGQRKMPFQAGDLFVIGAELPHVFKANQTPHDLLITSVFFAEDSLGQGFFRLPELYDIQRFLHASKRGIQIGAAHSETLADQIRDFQRTKGPERIIGLLTLLQQLSQQWQFGEEVGLPATESEQDYVSGSYYRLQRVFQYIADNFDRTISLEEVARLTHLNKYTFSRYFKKITHKSFVNYLNEFRIGVACRLLRRPNYSIAQISMHCGFNNLSHFYRQFKKYMRCTPKEYRKTLSLG